MFPLSLRLTIEYKVIRYIEKSVGEKMQITTKPWVTQEILELIYNENTTTLKMKWAIQECKYLYSVISRNCRTKSCRNVS